MPMTVKEYFIGQLYMTARSSQEETGKEAGEGIEILENKPYEENDPINEHKMPKGQYTYKIMHMKSKLPSAVAMIVPDSLTDIHEKSWNAFPHTLTIYSNKYFGEKFFLSVETMHLDDNGNSENAVNLSADDLKARKVDYVDIAKEDPSSKFQPEADPRTFKSTKTGRGPLAADFKNNTSPVMTCYKVVKLRFKVFGLQSKIESWGHSAGIRSPFLEYHRKIFCWIDEWINMTVDDIREMEAETKRITEAKLAETSGAAATAST